MDGYWYPMIPMNHHSWLAIWAHHGSSMFHILPYPIGLPPKRTSPPPLWRPCQTSVLFAWERVNLPPRILGRSEVNEVNDYIVILHIYIYLVGGWPTPSGKYNARKWSDHLHCSENAAIAVRAGLDSALWWSAHPLIQPDVIDARPVMIWTLPLTCLSFSELPIMTLDQSTCRIFRPHLSCASCSRV